MFVGDTLLKYSEVPPDQNVCFEAISFFHNKRYRYRRCHFLERFQRAQKWLICAISCRECLVSESQ